MAFKKLKEQHNLYKAHYFAGNELYCPFCGWFYKMDTYGKSKIKSIHCPVCASSKEERTLLLFLQSRTELLSGDLKILIISEKNEITEYFKNYPNVSIKLFNATGDFSFRDDEMRDKYNDDYFDVIICNYILEKLPDYKMVIKELNRIITSDGFMILQANIDINRKETFEMPVTSYNDRFKLYGILGNYRRFGTDYVKVLNDHGLEVLEYDFNLELDDIPEETLYSNFKFYLGYKDDPPIIRNYNEDIDDAINEHFRASRKSSIKALIYKLLFLVPEMIKKKIEELGSNLSEKQDNKNKVIYFIYILLLGSGLFWGSWTICFAMDPTSNSFFKYAHYMIGWPLFIVGGLFGMMVLAGYAFMEENAGYIKRGIVGLLLLLYCFLSIPGVFQTFIF